MPWARAHTSLEGGREGVSSCGNNTGILYDWYTPRTIEKNYSLEFELEISVVRFLIAIGPTSGKTGGRHRTKQTNSDGNPMRPVATPVADGEGATLVDHLPQESWAGAERPECFRCCELGAVKHCLETTCYYFSVTCKACDFFHARGVDAMVIAIRTIWPPQVSPISTTRKHRRRTNPQNRYATCVPVYRYDSCKL